jgi:hypothetical protein
VKIVKRCSVVGLLLMIVVPASASAATNSHEFLSAPSIQPPKITVTKRAERTAPGLIIASSFDFEAVAQQKPSENPTGPFIFDNSGQPVWFRPGPSDRFTLNTRVQRLAGKPVVTFWQGGLTNRGAPTSGVNYILGSDYRPLRGFVKSITGANGWTLSPHEFLITRRGTALATGYKVVGGQDLRAFGGSASGSVWDNAILEYDLKTGKLVYEWNMLGRLPLGESKSRPFGPDAWDAYHVNSIDEDADGDFLVSNRGTWSIHKVDRQTNSVQWTLGGNSSSFTRAPNAQFAYQHDARFLADNQISLFDNQCCGFKPDGTPAPPVYQQGSRGLILRLDHAAKTATMVREYKSEGRISGTQANVQRHANGNVTIGWGQQPFVSEFDETGNLLFEARFSGTQISYRALRQRWRGRPRTRPSVAVRPSGRRTRVYVSWNGATDVAAWRILAGRTSKTLKVVARRVRRKGFETKVTVRSAGPRFRVQALTSRGRVLRSSSLAGHVDTGNRFAGTPDY